MKKKVNLIHCVWLTADRLNEVSIAPDTDHYLHHKYGEVKKVQWRKDVMKISLKKNVHIEF